MARAGGVTTDSWHTLLILNQNWAPRTTTNTVPTLSRSFEVRFVWHADIFFCRILGRNIFHWRNK